MNREQYMEYEQYMRSRNVVKASEMPKYNPEDRSLVFPEGSLYEGFKLTPGTGGAHNIYKISRLDGEPVADSLRGGFTQDVAIKTLRDYKLDLKKMAFGNSDDTV